MIILMQILIYLYIFFIGAILGSFFNVVGIRVPKKETLLGRSHCPECNHTLGAFELVPVIGYIFLKGKCKNCRTPISVKYPLIEFITGALFLLSFVIIGQNVVEYILIVVFISLMVIITVSDLYYQIIPDIILLIFLPVIFTLRMFSPVILWYNALIGAVLGFGFMYLIAWYGKKRFGKEAIGGGDIKLYTVFLSVLFASLIGLVYGIIRKKQEGYIPFVPFIFAGSILTYFLGDMIITWYISLIF